MPKKFHRVAIVGRYRTDGIKESVLRLIEILQNESTEIVIEQEMAENIHANLNLPAVRLEQLNDYCELFIVVGGDGSLLQAATIANEYGIPVLGINRGRLGFLTDIHPNAMENKIPPILAGDYIEEERYLLSACIKHKNEIIHQNDALNDVVLLPSDIPHMIQFDIYVDNQFVCSERADGAIIATPTGSTAYALSSGGPILHPNLEAMVMVALCPHTLSARPLVIPIGCTVRLTISENNEAPPRLSCDGKSRVSIKPGDNIYIKRHPKKLTLIHPSDYSYFDTLRTKLRWNTNFFSG